MHDSRRENAKRQCPSHAIAIADRVPNAEVRNKRTLNAETSRDDRKDVTHKQQSNQGSIRRR